MNNKYNKHILKNGVTLYTYVNSNLKRTYVKYIINYGSDGKFLEFKYNGEKYKVLPGLAHYLEHILGEYSRNGDIYANFTKRGYQRNGITSNNYTSYYFNGIKDIKKSIKELIEAVDIRNFTKEDVEKSRGPIIEESRVEYTDDVFVLEGLINRNLFSSFERVNETLNYIGDSDNAKKIDYDMLVLAYDAFYYDKNKTLLIAGNFNEEDMIKYVESIYKNVPSHRKKVTTYNYDLIPIRKKEEIIKMDIAYPIYSVVFKMPIVNINLRLFSILIALHLFNIFKISNKLRNKKYIDKNIKYNSSIIDEKMFILKTKTTTKDNKKYLNELIKLLKKSKLSKKEFNLNKKTFIAGEAFGNDNLYAKFNNFENNIKYTNELNETKFIKNIRYSDYKKFIKSLNYDNYITIEIKNEDK